MTTSPARNASRDGSSDARTNRTAGPSTAARTGPIAGTCSDRARFAERDCRSRQTAPSAAATAACPLRPAPTATAGCRQRSVNTAASWDARIIPHVNTSATIRKNSHTAGRRLRWPISGSEREGRVPGAANRQLGSRCLLQRVGRHNHDGPRANIRPPEAVEGG